MTNSKLKHLLSSLQSDSEEAHSVVNLTDLSSAQLFGGDDPIGTLNGNNSCQNDLCYGGTNSHCTNTSCPGGNHMVNDTCTNNGCS